MYTKNMKMVEYGPCGSETSIQPDITRLLHRIVMNDGKLTLGELGYLNMNTVSYVEEGIEVKIFFAVELAMIPEKQVNATNKYHVNPAFSIFQNVLFVGDLDDAVTFEVAQVPKYDIIEDSMGRTSVKVKKKMENNVEVAVMHCNLGLVLASILDHDLSDPDYQVQIETLGSNSSDKDQIIIQMGAKKEFPIMIKAMYNDIPDYQGFSKKSVYSYLIGRIKESNEKRNLQKELIHKVKKDADKQKKKKYKIEHKKLSNYR